MAPTALQAQRAHEGFTCPASACRRIPMPIICLSRLSPAEAAAHCATSSSFSCAAWAYRVQKTKEGCPGAGACTPQIDRSSEGGPRARQVQVPLLRKSTLGRTPAQGRGKVLGGSCSVQHPCSIQLYSGLESSKNNAPSNSLDHLAHLEKCITYSNLHEADAAATYAQARTCKGKLKR